MSTLRFFRNGHACVVRFDKQTDCYWGYIGLEPSHEQFGSTFVNTCHAGMSKILPPPELTTNETMMKKWWLGFQGGLDKKKTVDLLTKVADEI